MSTFKADYIIARQEEIAGNTSSIPVKTVVNGTAKAWVNFNGTGTIAIRANFNVASITDNGTGDYTVNFATALASANYTIVGSCSVFSTGAGAATVVEIYDVSGGGTNPTTSATRVYVHRSAVSAVDASYVCVNILGN